MDRAHVSLFLSLLSYHAPAFAGAGSGGASSNHCAFGVYWVPRRCGGRQRNRRRRIATRSLSLRGWEVPMAPSWLCANPSSAQMPTWSLKPN